jgi:hypothetical protein
MRRESPDVTAFDDPGVPGSYADLALRGPVHGTRAVGAA